jgi:hypothetical protein
LRRARTVSFLARRPTLHASEAWETAECPGVATLTDVARMLLSLPRFGIRKNLPYSEPQTKRHANAIASEIDSH